MPYIVRSTSSDKSRYLISGFSNTGKTSSLITFIYGDYDYWSDDEHALAIEQAGKGPYSTNSKMAIINCPGEFGIKSLPQNTEHVTSYYYEMGDAENINDVRWSHEALKQFDAISKQVMKEKPAILVYDGIHNLWAHLMNRSTSGEYLAGLDLNINPGTGNNDPFRSARYYSQSHNAFGQYISALYTSHIPMIICTTLEEWEAGKGDNPSSKALPMTESRYLWPAIPGSMAKLIVSKFDARLSCQREVKCLHGPKGCAEHKANEKHFVWQFMSKGDVAGVGIKGLRKISKQMKETPYIHQSYTVLKDIIEVCK